MLQGVIRPNLGGDCMLRIPIPGRLILRLILAALLAFIIGAAFVRLFPEFSRRTVQTEAHAQTQDEPKKDDEKKDAKKEETLPLKPDGKIEFTTDEGSWLSLDVSPDGQTIVFELLGDIYT